MSQAIEADRLMNLGEFGRCSEGRDGSLIGVNLAVANEPAKEGRQPWIAVAGCRPPFPLSLDDAASLEVDPKYWTARVACICYGLPPLSLSWTPAR